MGLKLGRASLRMTCASPDRSSLVWIAPFLLRDLRQDYPGTCGGYALAVRAAHFLATFAVTADALPFMHPTAMQTNPTSAFSNFTWANMVYPKAKHRGLTIAGLTVSVACIATKSAASCPSWVKLGHSTVSAQCPAGTCATSQERGSTSAFGGNGADVIDLPDWRKRTDA